MAQKLSPGWYIVLYHDVSWEDSIFTRYIGGTCPPDLFEANIDSLGTIGELVSIDVGEELLRTDRLTKPYISIWFDDGLKGVLNNALPILQAKGLTAGVSLCSKFVAKQEFFWRFKLSYLNHIDGMRFVRSKLRKYDYQLSKSVKEYTNLNFSEEMLADIDQVYVDSTSDSFRQDAFRLFMDKSDVELLHSYGWTISNHTASHYRMSREYGPERVVNDFLACEEYLKDFTRTNYWVIPFGTPKNLDEFDQYIDARDDRYMVFVNNKKNTSQLCNQDKVLYRIDAPISGSVSINDRLFAIN